MGYTYPKTVEEARKRRYELRKRALALSQRLGSVESEVRKLDGFIAGNEEKVCVHCQAGPAAYADGFTGVTNIVTCDGFHCFDCARIKHGLAFSGPIVHTERPT